MSSIEMLNERQREAAMQTEGPVLILAGAGSGKTRVLTNRIAYMLEEKGVNPWNILAITFTNKAAGEMRERIDRLVGMGSDSIWVATFHSTCVRILRRHAELLGYDNNFTIYDTDDQKTVIKDVVKRLNLDSKQFKERTLMGAISSAKDELQTPEMVKLDAGCDYALSRTADVYVAYQEQLKKNNAMDFDDLIMKTVELFQKYPDVLENYQERFRYICVDEYQDTNTAQFELIRLLASKYRNICVVGDDDQSIYKFRGANIRNILDFEKNFPGAKVVKLEQNYRSTQNILDAANAVIANNRGRKVKSLWTDHGAGKALTFYQADSAYEEAEYIVDCIRKNHRDGDTYSDHAVLYRTNAQSRILEEKCIMAGIPYIIVGGVNFYSRKEIKDILAYLKTIDNGKDDLAVRRIINVPRRGIGNTTIDRVQEYADLTGISFYEALRKSSVIPSIGKAAGKLAEFVDMIQTFRVKQDNMLLADLVNDILSTTSYVESLEATDEEDAKDRIENIDEFITKVVAFEEANENATLSEFLEEVALVADIDSLDEDADKVLLMTIHGAKGLEFEKVFLAGMEDGLFPGYGSICSEDPMELEEERRLCYVGITRAKEELTITCARSRMLRGETQYNAVSRFVKEIPPLLMTGASSLFNKKSYSREDDFAEGVSSYERTVPKAAPVRSQAAKPFIANAVAAAGGGYSKPSYFGKSSLQKGSQMAGATVADLSYSVGDRVKHIKFGEGTVTDMKQGPKDVEVAVDFDKVGTKKMFASFAKLAKI